MLSVVSVMKTDSTNSVTSGWSEWARLCLWNNPSTYGTRGLIFWVREETSPNASEHTILHNTAKQSSHFHCGKYGFIWWDLCLFSLNFYMMPSHVSFYTQCLYYGHIWSSLMMIITANIYWAVILRSCWQEFCMGSITCHTNLMRLACHSIL